MKGLPIFQYKKTGLPLENPTCAPRGSPVEHLVGFLAFLDGLKLA